MQLNCFSYPAVLTVGWKELFYLLAVQYIHIQIQQQHENSTCFTFSDEIFPLQQDGQLWQFMYPITQRFYPKRCSHIQAIIKILMKRQLQTDSHIQHALKLTFKEMGAGCHQSTHFLQFVPQLLQTQSPHYTCKTKINVSHGNQTRAQFLFYISSGEILQSQFELVKTVQGECVDKKLKLL